MEGSKAARLAIISGSSSGVRHKPDGFPDQSTVRAARKQRFEKQGESVFLA